MIPPLPGMSHMPKAMWLVSGKVGTQTRQSAPEPMLSTTSPPASPAIITSLDLKRTIFCVLPNLSIISLFHISLTALTLLLSSFYVLWVYSVPFLLNMDAQLINVQSTFLI